MVKIDNKVWQHELQLTGGVNSTLAELCTDKLVLFFYPRANTPGCSTESQDFGAHYEAFKAAGCEVIGVSMDGIRKQQNFKAKFDMPFELVSDMDEVLCQCFAVIKEKNMYGKTFMGIERSTFVVNAAGEVVHEWRKVKVPGHVDEVLTVVKDM